MQTWAARVALSAIELLIAFGFGCAVFWGTFALGCRISKCVDWSGMPWMILGLVVGVIAGVAFWIAMWRTGERFGRRLVCDGVALTIGLAAYLVPVYLPQIMNALASASSSPSSSHIANPDAARTPAEPRPPTSPTPLNLRMEPKPR